MIEKKRIQIRRDLKQNWVETNPILLYGEIGFDLTNNKIKIGDGERPWNELSWVNEVSIDLSIFYTKEEIDTILNELNTNLSNDYYNKEQVNTEIQTAIHGIEFPTTDLSNYYTKAETNTEIQNAVDNIEIPTTDLSDYYTKSETNTEIQTAIHGIEFPTTDLSNYYTKAETNTEIHNVVDNKLFDYYTKSETNTEIQNAIDSIEIPEQQEVSNATITIIQGDNNQSFNLNQTENQTIMLENKDFNWFGNETSFETLPDEQKVNGIYYISDKIDYKDDITGQPYIVYKTSQLLNDKPFATTNDLPKEWFGTQEEFDLLETYETNTTYYIETTANSGGESVDLSNYYTKAETNTEIQNAIDNIEIPTTDLSNYYTKSETTTEIYTALDIKLSNDYYNKQDINTQFEIRLSDYYTKEETNTEIQNAIDSIETTDLSNYYTKEQVFNKEQTYSKTEIDNIVGLINNELEIIING